MTQTSQLETIRAILEKLETGEDDSDEILFSRDEITALRRVMLTEGEAKALRSVIEIFLGLKFLGNATQFSLKILTVIGAFIALYWSTKSAIVDWIRGVVK